MSWSHYLQCESFPYLFVHNSMFLKRISIDHVHVLYHRIVDVILRFVIYTMLLVDLNVFVRLHYDSIDLLIVELFRVNSLILFVNHEPKMIVIRTMKFSLSHESIESHVVFFVAFIRRQFQTQIRLNIWINKERRWDPFNECQARENAEKNEKSSFEKSLV